MTERATFSERTSLADQRTGASALWLSLIVGFKAVTNARTPVIIGLLVGALAASLLSLYSGGRHYRVRDRLDDVVPPPRTALAAALSVTLSCLAGLGIVLVLTVLR